MPTVKTVSRSINKIISHVLILGLVLLCCHSIKAQNNLSITGTAMAGAGTVGKPAKQALDANIETAWSSENIKDAKWVTVVLPGATEIREVRAYMETGNGGPVRHYAIQTFLNGTWRNQVEHPDNQRKEVCHSI